jgi:hypothetical protein
MLCLLELQFVVKLSPSGKSQFITRPEIRVFCFIMDSFLERNAFIEFRNHYWAPTSARTVASAAMHCSPPLGQPPPATRGPRPPTMGPAAAARALTPWRGLSRTRKHELPLVSMERWRSRAQGPSTGRTGRLQARRTTWKH